jgi:putative acetyltransferase
MEPNIDIIDYADEHAIAFGNLNREWLQRYGLLESHDELQISDPRGHILNDGGTIFLAKADGEIVGTAALVNAGNGEYELAKMAVTNKWQGRGIGKMLIEKCLSTAKSIGAERVTLFSNSQLQTAIKMYEKYGFKHIEVSGTPYETADVKMELLIK